MHTIADNQRRWDEHPWDEQGEEWSNAWGGSSAQWHFCVYPRVLQHLPADTMLEIATGYGRWTKFLIEQAKRYYGFDLLPKCAEHCTAAFGSPDRTFVANDGLQLTGVPDQSVDLVFSMDSLVHVDWPTLQSYLAETLRVLKPGGRAFIHHSNAAAAAGFFELPLLLQNWRAPDVSAEMVRGEVSRLGGSVRGQELINWGGSGDQLIDCFSTIQTTPCETIIVENPLFMRERAAIQLIAGLYAPA